ncbi:MAG: alpha/beta hydrolase [Gammaproteobacteria bacterium]|nr:MAG: alpha/beta hydrolase [Gammaproteobacteria bacterium]
MFYLTETKNLDEKTRSEFSGDFVELTSGVTRYEVSGPEDGEPLIFIHGFSVPYYLWDKNFSYMAKKGFRVVRYDLFGRGGSDRPNTPYNIELFRNQLKELLITLNLDKKPINICAVCMGSIIASDYICHNKKNIGKLALIGPAGIPGSIPNYNWMAKIPIWGDYLMQIWGDQELVSGLKKHLYRPELFPEYKDEYLHSLDFKGLKRALLSTNRNMNIDNALKLYSELNKLKKDICLIWGIEDRIVPIRLSAKLTETLAKATVKTVTEAGHVANYEQSQKVNKILLDFFSK